MCTLRWMAGESTRANRPFWLHQAVEYLIGAVFISSSIQSETPAIPAGLGVAVMLNAAFTHGPAGAFKVLHTKVHRVIDVVIIAAVLVAAVQPVVAVGDNARLLLVALAVVLAFVWWNTDFASSAERRERRSKRRAARADRRSVDLPSGEDIGKSAGRAVGSGINLIRRAKNRSSESSESPSATASTTSTTPPPPPPPETVTGEPGGGDTSASDPHARPTPSDTDSRGGS